MNNDNKTIKEIREASADLQESADQLQFLSERCMGSLQQRETTM